MTLSSFYLQAILTASLGGILFGYDMGVVSGALPPLSAYFHLTTSQQGSVVSVLYLGGGIGAATGGVLCDLLGRKVAILVTDVLFGAGAFWLWTAQSLRSVLLGRCLVGWAVAVSGVADVAYLHEISSVWETEEEEEDAAERGLVQQNQEKSDIAMAALDDNRDATVVRSNGEKETGNQCKNDQVSGSSDKETVATHETVGGRGGVVSVNEACISLGFLLAYAVAYLLGGTSQQQQQNQRLLESDHPNEQWRAMFAWGGILAIMQFIGMLFMPESPVWLQTKGRTAEARAVRHKIRGMTNFGTSQDDEWSFPFGLLASDVNPEPSAHSDPGTIPAQNSAMEAQNRPTVQSSVTLSPDSNIPATFECEGQFFPTNLQQPQTQSDESDTNNNSSPSPSTLRQVLQPYKPQCLIAIFLATSQQFCGHTSILNFSPEIFAQLGPPAYGNDGNMNNDNDTHYDNIGNHYPTPIQMTVGIGIVKFLTTCIVIWKVETVGRKPLLLAGMICIAVSQFLLWIAFLARGIVVNDDNVDINDNTDINNGGGGGGGYDDGAYQQQHTLASPFMNALAILGIYGVATGYAMSYGPLTWLITSELFPSTLRGRALGFATIVTYLAAGLVSRTFLSLQENFGSSSPFLLYLGLTLASIGFVVVAVPDTGKKDAEEIADTLEDMWFWNRAEKDGNGDDVGNGVDSSGCFCLVSENISESGPKLRMGPFFRKEVSWRALENYGTNGTMKEDNLSLKQDKHTASDDDDDDEGSTPSKAISPRANNGLLDRSDSRSSLTILRSRKSFSSNDDNTRNELV